MVFNYHNSTDLISSIGDPIGRTVYFDYDDRVHFMGNVYIVIERSKSVELFRDY